MSRRRIFVRALVLAALVGCTSPESGSRPSIGDGGHAPPDPPVPRADAGDGASADYPFPLPNGFPKPYVPVDNPLTREKVSLGRHLFYDPRLSGNGTQSCAGCHEQARAFADGRARPSGSTGETHPRSSMSLANVAYAASLTWQNPLLTTLEAQAHVPLSGIDPVVELGIRGREEEVMARLRADARYVALFSAAFPEDVDPFVVRNVAYALASFERTLVSGRSRVDRFRYDGETSALTAEEKRGGELFASEALECFHCHGGFDFTDAVVYRGVPLGDLHFHNTGLYDVDGRGAYPAESRGLLDVTGAASDMGRFKAPTLRNIDKTAPYMHDGSIATLEEVVAHYAAGGRTLTSGPHAGVGSKNRWKSSLVTGFLLGADDERALVAFLRALTDEAFLTNPALSDPWRTGTRDDDRPGP